MGLPNITHTHSKLRRQEVQFGGLDLTDSARAGALEACENLSTRRWPLLSPRLGRTQIAAGPAGAPRVTATVETSTQSVTPGSGITGATVMDWERFLESAALDDPAEYLFSAISGGKTATWNINRTIGGMTAALGTTQDLYGDWGIAITGIPAANDRITVDITAIAAGDPEPVDDLYEWDGVLLCAAGGILYYDGEPVCDVLPGKKQWAVVNTRLCIWPDRIAMDLTDRTVTSLQDPQTNAGDAAFTSSTLTLESIGFAVGTGEKVYTVYGAAEDVTPPAFWVYPDEPEWDAENEEWDLSQNTGYFTKKPAGKWFIPTVTLDDSGILSFGPPIRKPWNAPVTEDPENEEGYFGQIVSVSERAWHYVTEADNVWHYTYKYAYFDAKAAGARDPADTFSAGDVLTIAGTLFGWLDAEDLNVASASGGVLTFAAGTFPNIPTKYYLCENDLTAGTYRIPTFHEHLKYFTLTDDVAAGCVLLLFESGDYEDKAVVWDPDEKEILTAVTLLETGSGTLLTLTDYSNDGVPFTISKKVPELDYICESNNRLWGVNNEDRTIYASALGLPGRLYDYSGDAGAWTVAVGSEGDFTGICAYGGAVCCWKERHLHKVLGDYPSEYYTAERELSGVQAGSDRSLVNINDALYYKGVDGVYVYGGGSPTLVSAVFGVHRYADAAAGSDGTTYRISMTDGTAWHLMTFDTLQGLWIREDGTHATAFALAGRVLHMLKADGSVWQLDTAEKDTTTAGTQTAVAWSATFAPFEERDAHERKSYLRLLLRAETAGTAVTIEASYDGGSWKTVNTLGAGVTTAVIPVWPNRIDRLKLRLTGTAPAAILSLARELTAGSIWGGEKL